MNKPHRYAPLIDALRQMQEGQRSPAQRSIIAQAVDVIRHSDDSAKQIDVTGPVTINVQPGMLRGVLLDDVENHDDMRSKIGQVLRNYFNMLADNCVDLTVFDFNNAAEIDAIVDELIVTQALPSVFDGVTQDKVQPQ